MIDVRLKTIGGPEIARTFAQAQSGIPEVIRDQLSIEGDTIVARAESNAPKRTGIMASRIQWYFGREVQRSRGRGTGKKYQTVRESKKDPRIFFTVRPMGRVAHLVERGVNASFYQRPGARGGDKHRRGAAQIGPFGGEVSHGPDYRYARSLRIAPRPFFMPAVESVGGASGVNERLQRRLDWLAGNLASRAA